MLTLEEASDAFTARFTADVAARGAEMDWRRWPEDDYGSGAGQVIAYWIWPASDPASASPYPDDDENEDNCVNIDGFWLELRHEKDSAGPFPDGYAEFTIIIDGGERAFEYGVSMLAELYGDDDADSVVVDGERLPRRVAVDGTMAEFDLVRTMEGGRAAFHPFPLFYLLCPRCAGFAKADPRRPAACDCGYLAPDTDGWMRAEDGATHRIAIYQSGLHRAR